MYIAKQDALLWFEFFAQLPEEEPLQNRQLEIAYAVLAQIERSVRAKREAVLQSIPGLKSLKHRSLYVGPDKHYPIGCTSCLLGTGLGAIRRTNRCNLNCAFCYDHGVIDQIPPIGDGLWEIGGTKFYEEDLDLLLGTSKKPTGISYVYLEPFMEIEVYESMIRRFKAAGIRQHMYTNGTLADEKSLRMLGEAGLDELRFNLGASGVSDRVIQNIATAKKYIRQVGIETPMTREYFAAFHQKKEAILATGLDFMNSAELHLNANNLPNYLGEPMYMTRLGYLSPIFSRDLTLQLMKEAAEEGWPVVVHDCSNETKFARDLNLRQKEGGWFGSSVYGMEFDRIPFAALLPTLRDPDFTFVQEEPLPVGYRPGDLVF